MRPTMSSKHRTLTSVCLAIAAVLPTAASSSDAISPNYRFIGGTPASVAGTPQSPVYRLQIAGGSGSAVGIAASPNTSVVAGPTSTVLPTDRMFRDGLEGA